MEDEEMKDAAPAETGLSSDQLAQSIESATQVDVQDSSEIKDDSEMKEDEENEEVDDGGDDGEAGDDNAPKKTGRRWPKKEGTLDNNVYKALKAVADILTDHKYTKRNEDYYPSLLFRRIPNKRIYPDYHDLIKEPRAISSLKGKIQRKEYGDVKEYVRDFALIVHNAQIYNRPNSVPVKDVKYLEKLFNDEMRKLADEGIVKEEDLIFPDLGEIPDATPEPDIPSEEEIEEEEEDGENEDEEDEDADDSDEDGPKKRRKGRKSGGRKKDATEDEDGKGDDQRKKRGRPPKVDTPMEARIKAVLKGIRKPKDGPGALKIRHFERMPDKTQNPHYYQEIKNPIALDLIKRKAKRKKYQSLDHFMADIKLMFNNAMAYNEDASEIYQDAAELLQEAQTLADAEKAKPDSDFIDDEGRLPLPQGILYKNNMWKVGDWVHIENVNDVTKPIIAQIYRTWQDNDGQKWINACWYYRPEQTVHQYEKHFYPNEVVKTGQYRDHRIDEVLSKCFVMFFTRYSRGRPRGLPQDMEIYVCEARYNEEKHRMNKIKTWASCLPDEVRDRENDYEMDLFDSARKVKKVPSPLLHLLKEDAKDSKPSEVASQIQWGSADAPPILGAIYKGERDENQSPPPEPTPPPPPTPPPIVRPTMLPRPPTTSLSQQLPARASPALTPSITPQYPGAQASAPAYARQNSYQTQTASRPFATTHHTATHQAPIPQQPRPYAPQQQLHQTGMAAAHPTNYSTSTPAAVYPRQPLVSAQPTQQTGYTAATTHVPREQDVFSSVFVLPDPVNAGLPEDIRDQYPQDDQGRVLFFTKPPVDTRTILTGRSKGETYKPLVHSAGFQEYKAALKRRIKEKEEKEREMAKKKEMDIDTDNDKKQDINMADAPLTQPLTGNEQSGSMPVSSTEQSGPDPQQAMIAWAERMAEATKDGYRRMYGADWKLYYDNDELRHRERKALYDQERAKKKADIEAAQKLQLPEEDESPYATSYSFKGRNPWVGRYEDDFDPRYGF